MQEIRPGAHTLVPYFVVHGASELIDFMVAAFGAVEQSRFPSGGRIMHASLILGDSLIELGDANDEWAPMAMPVHLYIEDADGVYARAVAAGAGSLMAPVDQPYGDREAAVQDRWGNHWYIATHREGVRPPGFRTVTINVRSKGTDKVVEFLRDAFGAEETAETMRGDDGAILHAVMRIGDSMIELGEPHGPWGAMHVNAHLIVPDPDATYARALAAGAKSLREVADQPYGERGGGVVDPWGNMWWVARPLEP